MHDRRVSLKKGTCINVGSGEYVIDECISSGGQALIYRCHLKGYAHGQRYILKEYYPPEAVRENHVITEGPDWQFCRSHSLAYYYQKAKMAEENAALFRQKSHQAQFVSEIIPDDSRMVALMRMASDDCKTIRQKLEEWYPGSTPAMKHHSDLYRVRESVKIIKGVLVALSMLHGESCGKIVHRDLTPGNIFIAESRIGASTGYTVYPIDFSCSAPIGLPFDDEMSVSPGYTHPVLRENSHLLDLYSVAALLLVLVAGRECLHRVDNWEVNNLIVEDHFYIDEAVASLDIPFGVRSKLESVLKRAVSMRSVGQYASAKEMYAELETLEEIMDRRGMHPEILYDASAKEFQEQCENEHGLFRYTVEPDLVTEAIDCKLNQPINILEQNTILLGSGGAGKTTKIRMLWENCLKNWNSDGERSKIPVFVPLNTFDSSKDGKNFIKDYIAKQYFPDLSETDCERRAALMGMLRSCGRYILFLDGMNECVGSDKLNAEVAEFAAIENVTVLITSRNDLGDGWVETKKLFSTAELLPLNDDLIIRKLKDGVLGSPSQRLLETLRRPMFFALYLKNEITDQAVETPGQILYAHHRHLLDAQKTGNHGDEWTLVAETALDKVLPQLASAISKMYYCEEELGRVLGALLAECRTGIAFEQAEAFLISRGFAIRMALLTVLQNCGIIRSCGAKQYAFTHQNYLEFYQALDVYNQMAAFREGKRLPDALSAGVLPDAVMHFLGDILGEHEFQNKTDCDGSLSPIEEWLQRHCAGKKDRAAQMAVRNLVETMKVSANKQFRGHTFRNLDLTLTNFYDCDLAGSDFSCTQAVAATFIRQGHDHPIDEVMAIPENNWILSSSSVENHICIWDAATGAQVGSVGGNHDPLSAFSLSADRKLIIADESHHAVIYSLESKRKFGDTRIDYGNPETESDEEICEPQNYKWLSADNKEVFFAKRGSRKLVIHQLGANVFEKYIEKTADTYFSFAYPIQCCEMSADYRHLYILLRNGELWIWDTERKACLAKKKYTVPGNANHLAVAPCGTYALLCADTKELFELDLYTGTMREVNVDASLLNGKDRLLFAAASSYYLWYDGYALFRMDRDNRKSITMPIAGITGMYLDWKNDKVYLGTCRGEIQVADAKTLRLLSTFDCGERNDWEKPHTFLPHWYDGGLARITKQNQVQCLTSDGFKALPASNLVCSCFDGNYHIGLVEEESCRLSLVIRDLRGGTVVGKIPFDPLCKAYNAKGEEIFGIYSEFHWVRYFPKKGRIIVNYSVGLVKSWDIRERMWHSIGHWDQEVEHILSRYDCFEPDDWEMIEASLADLAMRNHIFGNHIVQGTFCGHLLWWDFDGNLCRDDHPHRGSTKIHPVPDSVFFITEGLDFTRCIWNWETMEPVDTERRKVGAKRGYVLKILQNRDALPVLRGKHGGLRFWYEYLEHAVLICCEMDGYYDLKSITCNGDIVVYTTNHFLRVCSLYDHQHDHDFLLRTHKTLMTEDADSWVNYSLNNGNCLAAAFADGTVVIFDFESKPSLYHRLEWHVTSTADVSGCQFTQANLKGYIHDPLRMNGALLDGESMRFLHMCRRVGSMKNEDSAQE